MDMNALEKAFEENVLDKDYHLPLLKDIQNVASSANIPVHMIYTSMVGVCRDEEIEYVKAIRQHEATYGLIYVGKNPKPSVHRRMMVAAGTLLRNYINVKVMTMQDVVGEMKAGRMPRPHVLMIPNFFEGSVTSVPDWQVGVVLDMLYSRMNSEQQTFLYVSNMQELKDVYSDSVVNHLTENFKIIAT